LVSNRKIVDAALNIGIDFGKEIINFFTEAFFNTKIQFPERQNNDRMGLILDSCGLGSEVKKESDNSYLVTIPLGKTIRDYEKRAKAIETALGKDTEVSFQLVGESKVRMRIVKAVLLDQYPFEPIPLTSPAEILIGHSRRGLVTVDLTKYPNMLIAGATGSGKSTYLVGLILNILLTSKTIDLHLIDLKSGIEFHNFQNCTIVKSYATEIEKAEEVIDNLTLEMERRQQLLVEAGVVKLDDYNERQRDSRKLPYEIVIVDEFADLRGEKAVKAKFDKLLRKGRNVGIFFILSTQRPTADTVPGNLSANIQCRLAFHTSTAIESQIILGYGRFDAAKPMPIGRGIFQAYDTFLVQPMFIKNDERIIVPIIRHLFRSKSEKVEENINRTGMIKC
jgi:S-DNA-T family DNA segregation ATPase FtsK/SpoIIIE